MDAIDLVLTEFDGDEMKDICSYSMPYTRDMREKMQVLRTKVLSKTRAEIEALPDFRAIHDEYIIQVGKCVDEMCALNGVDKKTVDAIGFHGKTLDHNPPSKAQINKSQPYTLQIGSGQMLADLTGVPVVYDFRSDFVMKGFEGAPLVGPHNAHIARLEGDGCYYNGGNTSNFAIVANGQSLVSTDAGPFNEYVDAFVRLNTAQAFDKDGRIGKKGKIEERLLRYIFELGRDFYDAMPPKSGDPAYYHKDEIFEYIKKQNIGFENAVRTFECASAYLAVYALGLIDEKIKIPSNFILFGGGWKNPVVQKDFELLLDPKGPFLPEHKIHFERLRKNIKGKIDVHYSVFGEYMEARLMADMARFRLENKPWDFGVVAGVIAEPQRLGRSYADCVNRSVKGWL